MLCRSNFGEIIDEELEESCHESYLPESKCKILNDAIRIFTQLLEICAFHYEMQPIDTHFWDAWCIETANKMIDRWNSGHESKIIAHYARRM